MCGIAGIISPGENKHIVEEMLATQAHRGPDNSQIYTDNGFVCLGHNRLSIIDITSAANQPFIDNSERYIITFNGEIYNYLELKEEIGERYQFQTNSDTEVLLASFIIFGKECLSKLNGMFSFAIWDKKEKILFAARDRFGVKPFYFSKVKNKLFFASEIKTLQKAAKLKEPNEKVWANYFAYGSYGLPTETFFKDIAQLSGGFYLEYKNGILTKERWYDFVERVNNLQPPQNVEEIKSEYLQLLKESIKLRFRSDVAVGFNLSGGVDSSLLLALVNSFEDHKDIEAFTFYCDDHRYDELYWVKQMIEKFDNPLNSIELSSSETPEYSLKISNFQDEPFGGIPTLAYSKLFEAAKNKGIKVVLDGQGLDEQWGGYDYYSQKADNNIQGQKENVSPFRINCIDRDLLKFTEKITYPKPFKSDLQNLQFRDLFYTKIPRALRFNDRISMAASVELREPFLDYRLVEFAFSLPDNYKINGEVHKYLLREIISDFLPHDVSNAPKRPLQTPQREWLEIDLKVWVEQRLKSLKTSKYSLWFNFKEIDKEWAAYLKGDNSSSFHIWQWINFSILMEEDQILS